MTGGKKFLSILTAITTIFWSAGIFLFIPERASALVVETTAATELVTSGQRIKASSNYVALFGFGLTQNAGETLEGVTLQINQTAGTVASSDFAGLYVFADNGATDDVFDGTDTLVGTEAVVNVGMITGILTPGAAIASPITGNYNFIVVVRTSATISNGDAFSASVPGGVLSYLLSAGDVNATALVPVNALTADTAAPTATASGGPPDGQIGPPVDAMVDRQFSENLASGTVTTANIRLQANAGNVLGGDPSGSPNLCTSAVLSGNTRIICMHATLASETWYTFTVTAGVTDTAGNALGANYTSQFRTSSFGGGGAYNPPPFVLFTLPSREAGTLPTNGKMIVEFSKQMKVAGDGSVLNINNVQLFTVSGGVPTGSNLFLNTVGWSSDDGFTRLIITPPTLIEDSNYRLIIKGVTGFSPATWSAVSPACGGAGEAACVLSEDNLPLPSGDYFIDFRATAADNTGPSLMGSSPDNGVTGVDRASFDLSLSFNEMLNRATVSSTTVKLYCNDTDNNAANGCNDTDSAVDGTDVEITGTTVALDDDGRVIHLSPNAILGNSGVPTDKFLIRVVSGDSGVKDVVGNAMTSDSVRAFSVSDNVNGEGAAAYDDTAPTVMFANADNFGIFITFSEAMKFNLAANSTGASSAGANDVNNVGLWTIESSPDGTSWSTVPLTNAGTGELLSGKSIRYEPHTKTLMIDGLAMPPGQRFRATASSSIQDLSSNGVGTPNQASGSVGNSATTGGQLGPGGSAGGPNFFNMGTRPIAVFPKSAMAGITTRYKVEFPADTVITASGKITLTYPSGFVFVAACDTWPTDTFENADINGPAIGTVSVASIVCNSLSRSITITLGAVATQAGDMIRFEIQGVTNSTVPKDFSTSGYSVDIKTYNASNVLLESKTSMPFFISAPGTNIIQGKVFVDADADGTLDGGESGVDGTVNALKVCLGGPTGFECKTIDASGDYSFTALANGFYHLEIPSISSGNFAGGPFFRDVNVTGSQTKTENFPVTAVAAGSILDVYISGGAALAGTKLDIFGFSSSMGMTMGPGQGPGGFTVKEVTLNGSGVGTTQLPLSRGNWQVGVGPWMPKEPGTPPAPPDFTFMPPKPVEVTVTDVGVPDLCLSGAGEANELCFTLTASTNQIKGKAVDGSGNAISNVFVMARPSLMADSDMGAAGGAQTDTNGLFNIKVVPGTYIVEAFMPGMPPSNALTCTVRENDVANVDGNATADVYCDGTLIANDIAGFSGSSITISSITSNDLILTIAKGDTSVSGRVLDEAGNAIPFAHVSGMEVDNSGNPLGGWSDTPTDNSGNYTLYVKGGTEAAPKKWQIRAFAPGFGELPAITVAVVQGTNLTGKNLQAAAADFGKVTGIVTQAGTPVAGAFVGIHGANGGNGTVTGADGAYTLKTRAGTGYAIDGFVPGQGPTSVISNVTVTANTILAGQNLTMSQPGTIRVTITGVTDAFVDARDSSGRGNGTGSNPTAGVYDIVVPAGTYAVRANNPTFGLIGTNNSVVVTGGNTTSISFTPPSYYTVSGTVSSSESSCSEGATVSLSDSTNGRVILAPVNSVGAWSVSFVPNGSYSVIAAKPGCIDNADPGTVNISGANVTQVSDTDLARTLVKTNSTISGRVWLDADSDSTMDSGENITFDTMVFATSGTGRMVVADVDISQGGTSNNYTLDLSAGTWAVKARSDGYESAVASVVVADGGSETQNLQLTTIAGYTRREPQPYTVRPSQGGIVRNNDIGENFEVNIPAGALGSSSNDGSILTRETSAVADPTNDAVDVLNDTGIEVTPKDASGNIISTISSSSGSAPTITIPYDPNDLPAGSDENDIIIAAWDGQQWDTLATNCDVTNNICTAAIEHFSTFAPIVPVGGGAPSTPSGLATTASSSTQVQLSWTVVGAATSYDIYRDTASGGSFPRIGSEPTVSSGATTTYTDTGLSPSTTYYYKISALNGSGESAASSAVSVITLSGGGAGGGGSDRVVVVGSYGVAINSGAITTNSRNVTLTLTAATGTTEMLISNNVGLDGVWEAFSSTKSWVLSEGDGIKTVYVSFRGGSSSAVVTDTITLSTSSTPAAPESSSPASSVPSSSAAATLEQMSSDSATVAANNLDKVLSKVVALRDLILEAKNLSKVKSLFAPANLDLINEINNFVSYGTPTTKLLGAGERLGAVNSYKTAFKKLPNTTEEWNDVIKIANGRWPKERSELAENRAKLSFEAIYLRKANMVNAHDNAAVTVMAYGLRPAKRNLNSEKAAIKSYKAVFNRQPITATAWDAVRAISYSGAKR